jgi:hypothetical protein
MNIAVLREAVYFMNITVIRQAVLFYEHYSTVQVFLFYEHCSIQTGGFVLSTLLFREMLFF